MEMTRTHQCAVWCLKVAWFKNAIFTIFQPIFSSGKSIESIIMAMQHDKGIFDYEDKISKHWPEFGQNGKENIKICDVFR